MSNKKWLAQERIFTYGHIPSITDKLPVGVYELGFDAFRKCFILELVTDGFLLPSKIYGLETDLIKRVKHSFNTLDKNFGVLLKGIKGTGKTITGKIISNELQLPVILITKPWNDMASFINSIDQDVILFFDEFEKIYEFSSYMRDIDDMDDENSNDGVNPSTKGSISNLLMLMDGTFTSTYKRLFILTTNSKWLPSPLLSRPSRIRYVKDFSDITLEMLQLILNDLVVNKELIPGLLDLFKTLEIVTVDIVKSVAEEANVYNTADPTFFSIFNLTHKENKYEIFRVTGKGRVKVDEDVTFHLPNLVAGRHVNFNGSMNFNMYRVTKVDHKAKTFSGMAYDANGDVKKVEEHFVYKEYIPTHHMFAV